MASHMVDFINDHIYSNITRVVTSRGIHTKQIIVQTIIVTFRVVKYIERFSTCLVTEKSAFANMVDQLMSGVLKSSNMTAYIVSRSHKII